MILYHGSNIIVEQPDNLHSKDHLDFGTGFYTTSVQIQAERWAKRKAALHGKKVWYLSIYEMQEVSGFIVHDFGENLDEWIDFVCNCRAGLECFRQYDVIKGKVANDKVIRVVDMYMRKLISKEQAIKDIRIYETYDQIAFISQQAMDAILSFRGSYEVKL